MNLSKTQRYILIAALSGLIGFLPACGSNSSIGSDGVSSQNCNFLDNLSEAADSFISRCRKGSIRREFPGNYYSQTLGDIDRDTSKVGKKARKLLNDSRFKK